MKAVHELEALISNYKAIVTALEKDLKDARANPVVSEDTQAKQKLLAELERERAAREKAEEGTPMLPANVMRCFDSRRQLSNRQRQKSRNTSSRSTSSSLVPRSCFTGTTAWVFLERLLRRALVVRRERLCMTRSLRRRYICVSRLGNRCC